MKKRDFVFTSESVSEGHPDKVCDRISDALVDTFLAAEPEARCGLETLATTNRVVLADVVKPGDKFQIAVFGVNGPISVAPMNFVWFREAKMEFFR